MIELPDYGKLNFGTKLPKKWNIILPRATETSMLINLLSKLLTLNPKRRLTARQTLDHKWLKEDATDSSSIVGAKRSELRDELIKPIEMIAAVSLAQNVGNFETVERLGLGVAEMRRSIFSPSKHKQEVGYCWQGPILTTKSCNELSYIFKQKFLCRGDHAQIPGE